MKQSVDLIIDDAKLVNKEEKRSFEKNQSLVIHEGKILKIGDRESIHQEFLPKKSLLVNGKLILPGLINTHCHLFQTFMRGLGKDLTFIQWMNNSVRLMMPNMDEEAIYLAAMVGCLESVRSGMTTILDFMYAHVKPRFADNVLQAFVDCGVRGILARGMTDVERLPGSTVKPASYATAAQSFAEVDRSKAMYAENSTITFMLAPSVVWGMTFEGLKEISQYAKQNKMMVTMHILETVDDDQHSLEKYGKTTMRVLEDAGILDTDFLGVHAIRVSKDDLSLFKQYNVKISYNPLANMILGSGIAPIVDLSKAGIKISLGTDGAASNDSQNLIEVMKAGALIQKANNHDSAALSAWEVFSMATDQGAACIGMDDKIGAIEVGKQADLIIVDLQKANTTPCYDPIASFVYSGNSENIDTVIVNGEVIYNQGKFSRIDEEDILTRAQKKAEGLYRYSLAKN